MADKDRDQDWQNESAEDHTSGLSSDHPGLPGDDILKQHLADYTPDDAVHGWEKLSASLDAADEAFDRTVHSKIRQYHPPYDPHAWSQFAKRFSAQRHLRSRIILLKVSEAIAVILLLFTAIQLKDLNTIPANVEIAGASDNNSKNLTTPKANGSLAETNIIGEQTNQLNQAKENAVALAQRNRKAESHSSQTISAQPNNAPTLSDRPNAIDDSRSTEIALDEISTIETIVDNSSQSTYATMPMIASAEISNASPAQSTSFLSGSIHPIETPSYEVAIAMSEPVLIAPRSKRYLEFGMLVQGDYNQLKMPGDKVNTNAKQFTFPLQGLTSPGYGAGLTLALNYPRWAIETGAIYNAKNFSPDREVVVEDAFATSNVELEKMLMQFISIPLQARYKFDPHGRIRTYAQAGFGMHMIMQSHADVDVEYDFPTLVEGEDPNADPALQRTIRQTQRASEDLRDQAPFSTKSLVSANLGLGIEYDLFEDKTIFIQSLYQYQIPNLRFKNHGEKHLVTLSIQAGVRAPISR